ncbi:MAG TPA: pilus assembly protein TadG-related protein [Gaiellaceae bacterium]|nr:pilus assembly protein TadG-related protein [Gaiellaceae bacterium]HET8651571.1 pilus assembly protein TadG-related protein [Gaiellaceae bacterium]
MTRHIFGSERAQSAVITVVFMFALLSMAAAVLDVGSWYRAHRKLQANADAAALAGAQELPESVGRARLAAVDYADRNDGAVVAGDVQFPGIENDTIEVTARRPAPGIFAKLFGLDSVKVRARAVARVGVLGRAKWAAPIAVDWRHEKLQCKPTPCFNDPTTIDFNKTGPGAFRLINIDSSHGGTGSQDIGNWIEGGLDAWMDKDRWYYSDPGLKPNSSHVIRALDIRDETELLLPVYDATRAQGAGFEYYVIGWAVFHVTGFTINGASKAWIEGYFVDMIWEGIESGSPDGEHFGARAVSLVE